MPSKNKKSKKHRKSKKKDPNAPKKSKSAYMFFCESTRAQVKNELGNVRPPEILRRLGELWRDLPEEEKKQYNEKSTVDKLRYNEAKANYQKPESSDDSGDDDSDSDAGGKKRKHKKKKDPNAPKRAMSAYMFYSQAKRGSVKAQNPSMKATDIMREIAEQWRNLPDEAKTPYVEQANQDKARYEQAKANYNGGGGGGSAPAGKRGRKKKQQQEEEPEEEEEDEEEEEEDEEDDDDEEEEEEDDDDDDDDDD